MTMNRNHVLVAEDDADLLALVRELLAGAGYDVSEAADGREAMRAFYETKPDLVILDVGMPALDGWETLERIRELSDVPVLMLSARATDGDKVRGLRSGADDYVTKPFADAELLARVEALLRRSRAEARTTEYADGLLTIDFPRRSVTAAGTAVPLTPLEFKLLSTFVRHPDEVLSRERLLELVWGTADDASPDQVRLYVLYLRRKLEAAAPGASPIETLRGFGYRYRPPNGAVGSR